MNITLKPEKPIIIVDDEPEILLAVDTTLRMAGFNHIITLGDSRDVMGQLKEKAAALIILDLNMPHMNGERILNLVNCDFPEIPVIVLTGTIDIETAVRCMKQGALDYVVKPVKEERLLTTVNQALTFRGLVKSGFQTPDCKHSDGLKNPGAFEKIITRNQKMVSIFQYAESVSTTSQPVLIIGETGVGKELISRSLHDLSGRKGKLVTVNVAGLDDTIFSDTLFGHVKGAFTGADTHRQGLIEQAEGGTLFLDEIGDLALSSQVKLLRLLQEGEYMPLGSDKTRFTDARIIASTNRDLMSLEKRELFRKDLIYRLSTHTITIPPLRNRIDDLPLLLAHFIRDAARELNKQVPIIPESTILHLKAHPFQGNIRELKSIIFDNMSRYQSGNLSPDLFRSPHQTEINFSPDKKTFSKLPTLKEATWDLVDKAMNQTNGNQSAAAKILGISQQALSKRLKNR